MDPKICIKECSLVYPPSEDTFLLLQNVDVRPGERVLEVGCGTGIIALHCAKAGARVTAADINPRAVDCARANAKTNRLEVDVRHSDLFMEVEGRFDLILFNPPYVPDEIRGDIERSWAGGEDGIRVLERFLRDAPSHLEKEGRILVLLSTTMQDVPLRCVLSQFVRDRLASKRLFFEELWLERLTLKG